MNDMNLININLKDYRVRHRCQDFKKQAAESPETPCHLVARDYRGEVFLAIDEQLLPGDLLIASAEPDRYFRALEFPWYVSDSVRRQLYEWYDPRYADRHRELAGEAAQ